MLTPTPVFPTGKVLHLVTDAASGDIRLALLPGATRRPHVCFVAPEAWPVLSGDPSIETIGGAEVQQSILARLLARSGYRVSMICLDYGQPQRVTRDGVTVIHSHAPDAGLRGLRFFHPRLSGMWRAMHEVDADIYYQRSAGMLTAVVTAFCRRYRRKAIYAGASDSDFLPGQQLIGHRRDRWLFKQGLAAADVVVVQNETQQRDCLANFGRASILIPSCYELPPATVSGIGDSVLWVATLRPGKRPELFIEMAKQMPQRRFVMVGGAATGDPGGSDYYEAIRSAAALVPNLEFVGFLPLEKVEPYFDRARVVVNTSKIEGMPNVFLQAWARGVPTLAFIDVGAYLDGKSVYRVVDRVATAGDEIERLFADDLYRNRCAARCRDYFATTHGSTQVLVRYARVLDDLDRREQR